jgi:predicted lipid carrier protein YhbT
MASVDACRTALDELSEMLAAVDPELRARHVPDRTVHCRVSDLDLSFVGRIGADGVRDLVESDDEDPQADVRVTMTSDQLVALANRDEDFLHGWLRGRIQVSASMRDLLRLRSLFGL